MVKIYHSKRAPHTHTAYTREYPSPPSQKVLYHHNERNHQDDWTLECSKKFENVMLKNRLRSEFIWTGKNLTLGVKLYLQNSPCTYLTSSLLWKICVLLYSFHNLWSAIRKRFFFQPNIKKFKICSSICFISRQPVIVLLLLTSNFPVLNSVIYLVRPSDDFFFPKIECR